MIRGVTDGPTENGTQRSRDSRSRYETRAATRGSRDIRFVLPRGGFMGRHDAVSVRRIVAGRVIKSNCAAVWTRSKGHNLGQF